MIPATFPFILTTNILNSIGGIQLFNKLFGKGISYIFKCSQNGAYATITGLLCGYPIGAKTVSATALVQDISSKDEAHYLLTFCSIPSPVYLMNYVIDASLKKSSLTLPYLTSVYAGMLADRRGVFYLFYFRKRFIFRSRNLSDFRQYKPQTVPSSAKNLNTSMMSALTVIQKMGIYMILFSILATLIMQLPGELASLKMLKVISAGICEQTIGVFVTVTHIENNLLSCLICMFLTCFGGIAVAMQAKSLTNQLLDFSFYIKGKLLHAMYSSFILGILLIYFI